VGSIENSQVVSISVTDKDPERAAEIANTTARVFKEVIPTIMEFNGVRLLSDAKVNSWPINQKGDRWPLIGLIAGIVIGVGFIFLLDSLDDSLRTENEIEEILELPVLGRVPKQSKRNLNKRVNKEVRLEARGETSGFN